jgi:multiple antibiotic resistance protein
MNDFPYMFAILFMTLGPIKIIPVFFLLAHQAPWAWRISLAARATVVASLLVAFIVVSASCTLEKWKIPVDALVIAGGIILFLTAMKPLLNFDIVEISASPARDVEREAAAQVMAEPAPLRWLGKPVVSPLAVPSIVTPVAIVAVLFFLGRTGGDPDARQAFYQMLVIIMGINFVAMLAAVPLMRIVGLPILQLIGWVFAMLQAGFAVTGILSALRRLQIIP